jgi:putative ABC transport system substrate-binding protein
MRQKAARDVRNCARHGERPVKIAPCLDFIHVIISLAMWFSGLNRVACSRSQGDRMIGRGLLNRRRFVAACAAVIVGVRSGGAQQSDRVYRIAILTRAGQGAGATETPSSTAWRVWEEELRRLGYVEGGNLVFDRRVAEDNAQHARELADGIVHHRPDAIFAVSQNAVQALKTATATIPIIAIVADPIGFGFADSLARPGGNVTGFTIDAGLEILAKRFALFKEVVPTASKMACLTSRPIWEGRLGGVFQEAARHVGITMIGAPFDAPAGQPEYRRVFSQMLLDGADSYYAAASLENLAQGQLIAQLAVEARLPGVHFYRENVLAGGLMAYGVNIVDIFRRSAEYIDRVLKGADPAELPFQQPTTFELVINAETALALGIAIPDSILMRADVVIE